MIHFENPVSVPKIEQDRWKKFYEDNRAIHTLIEGLETPLGHGSTSEFLNDILDKGLGESIPEKAFARTKNATDLRKPDGLLGAYLFGRFNLEDLQVTSEEALQKSAIARYVEINSGMSADLLREQFSKYAEKRKPEGFPVLFIYEGGDQVQIKHVNPRIPSEVEFKEKIDTAHLRSLLVPQSRIAEVQQLFVERGRSIPLFSIEALEVGS